MALSPAVLKQQAAALELKKQPEKALALYQQLLDEHSGSADVDVALRNRVGDLHLRVGQIDDAIGLFEKSADEYALSGFLNNAIALCNKILRQRPGHVPTLRRLARFSAEKGMIVDAQRHYLSVAESLEKLGQHGEALKALSEFAELSPEDVHVRSVVIEQLLRAGRKPDALPHLTVLHRLHAVAGRSDEADGVAQVAREIDEQWVPDVVQEIAGKRNDPSLVFIDSDDDFGALETSPMPGSEPDTVSAPQTVEGLESSTREPIPFDAVARGGTVDGFETTVFAGHEPVEAPVEDHVEPVVADELVFEELEPVSSAAPPIPDAAPHEFDFVDFEADSSPVPGPRDAIPTPLAPMAVPESLPEASGLDPLDLDAFGLGDAPEKSVETITGSIAAIVPEAPVVPPPAALPPRPKRLTPTYVNLFEILHEDEPTTSRMTIGEPKQTGDHEADFQHILSEFRDGIDKTIPLDDADSHYDLGIAFREMGLIDDAIAEFQIASRSRLRRIESIEAAGGCFLDKGEPAVARTVLLRALDEQGSALGDDGLRGVLYLLGVASEALGARDEGLRYYQRVYAVDIRFRDVAARIRTLQQPV
jgi:tetratricopeptide (TPR) repeat protein